MLIRYGYEMTFTCDALTSNGQPARRTSLQRPRGASGETPFAARPHVASWLYADVFGNRCRRFNAPSGDLTISNAGVIEVNGLPDPVTVDAAEIPVADLPDDTLLYLVGSRYASETDKLSQIAWDHFGHATAGWPRVQAICDFVNGRIAFRLRERPFLTRKAAYEAYAERVGVCRDFAHLAVAVLPLHETIPARYCNGYPQRRHRRAAGPGLWISAAWFSRRFWAANGIPFDARHNMPRIGAYPDRARTRCRRTSRSSTRSVRTSSSHSACGQTRRVPQRLGDRRWPTSS